MKETKIIMGMPITIELENRIDAEDAARDVFDYFTYVDETFSPFKTTSELSKINRGELREHERSEDMKTVFALSEQTRIETDGYFDITTPEGIYNPSGLVKGWAIWNASKMLDEKGFKRYYVNAGGDIQVRGKNSKGENWKVGIRNPLSKDKIVKAITPGNGGTATSGIYERGEHIYNPHMHGTPVKEILSITVIGPDIYEADRFATAAFAMGRKGILFIERRPGLEGYMIDTTGLATMTSGFEQYVS